MLIIIICVLTFLLLCSLLFNVALWKTLLKNIELENPKDMIDEYLEENTVETIPCTLLVTMDGNKGEEIFDFSKYEEFGVVGYVTGLAPGKPDDEPKTAIMPNQKVCKLKDGSYIWDFRHLL